jgi:hypothetical protein
LVVENCQLLLYMLSCEWFSKVQDVQWICWHSKLSNILVRISQKVDKFWREVSYYTSSHFSPPCPTIYFKEIKQLLIILTRCFKSKFKLNGWRFNRCKIVVWVGNRVGIWNSLQIKKDLSKSLSPWYYFGSGERIWTSDLRVMSL